MFLKIAAAPQGHRGYGATSPRGTRLSFPKLYGSFHRAARPPAQQLGGTSVPTPTQGFLGRSRPEAEQARQLPPPLGAWPPIACGNPWELARPGFPAPPGLVKQLRLITRLVVACRDRSL